MTDEELLKTPLRELTSEQKTQALMAYERKVAAVMAENKKFKPSLTIGIHIMSDDFKDGAIFCPADGKTYDSKSAYKKAVKSKGYEIVGEKQSPTRPVEQQIDWKGAVAETLERMGR
jgi:hypothetical protein